jgi:imidazolonepropionase-like amidohydrolase
MVEREFEGQPPLPMLDRETVKSVVAAAHRQNKLAVVHATYPDLVRVAVESGADVLAHMWLTARRRSDADTDDQLVSLIREHGASVIPTLTILESLTTGDGRSLLEDSTLARRLSDRGRKNLASPHLQLKVPFVDGLNAVRLLHQAGVPVLAGTDAAEPGVEYGISLHREMELLVRAGLSPLDALKAATSNPARAFRLEGRGRIAVGGPADLVLVSGDPTRDILSTRRIESIWKCGVQLDGQ